MATTIKTREPLVGGPELIVIENNSYGNGDTAADIDLTSYIENITGVISVMIFVAAAAHAVATIDYTTTAGHLAITFADPTADIVIYATVTGR